MIAKLILCFILINYMRLSSFGSAVPLAVKQDALVQMKPFLKKQIGWFQVLKVIYQ